MLDFACTNTECQSPKGTMCGCMTVTTDHSRTRERETLLRTDYMHDTLTLVPEAEVSKTKSFYVLFEGEALCARVSFLDELSYTLEVLPGRRRDILLYVSDIVERQLKSLWKIHDLWWQECNLAS